MRKMTFYPTMFHTNPFSFNRIEIWDEGVSDAKELFLRNGQAKEMGISKMKLSVIAFAAIDQNGMEIFQRDFPNRIELNPNGIDTEFFIDIKSTLRLHKGTYTAMRFYVAPTGNLLFFNNGRKETLEDLEYLDFQITDELYVDGSEELEVRMRFDFEPFSLKSFFGSLLGVFKKPKPNTGRLVNC